MNNPYSFTTFCFSVAFPDLYCYQNWPHNS